MPPRILARATERYDGELNAQAIADALDVLGLSGEQDIRGFVCGDPDRQKHYALFELAAARKFSMLLWSQVPASWGLPKTDKGIDCLAPDMSRAVQAKWYRPGTSVPFAALSTFYTLGQGVLRIPRLTVVTSERVALCGLRPAAIEHQVISNAEFTELLAGAQASVARARQPRGRWGRWPRAPRSRGLDLCAFVLVLLVLVALTAYAAIDMSS